MTIYGRSDIDSISIGDADHTHERKKGDGNITITCAFCEPRLINDPMWSSNPREIPLTPDEVHDIEDAQNNISRFEAMRIAEDARAAADMLRGDTPKARGSAR